jgi:hypothetical protein
MISGMKTMGGSILLRNSNSKIGPRPPCLMGKLMKTFLLLILWSEWFAASADWEF